MDNLAKLESLLAKQRAIASELRLMKGDYILANNGEDTYDALEEAEDAADTSAQHMINALDAIREVTHD